MQSAFTISLQCSFFGEYILLLYLNTYIGSIKYWDSCKKHNFYYLLCYNIWCCCCFFILSENLHDKLMRQTYNNFVLFRYRTVLHAVFIRAIRFRHISASVCYYKLVASLLSHNRNHLILR